MERHYETTMALGGVLNLLHMTLHRLITIAIVFCCVPCSFSQPTDTSAYPFIQYDKNILAFPGGIESYTPFYHMLQKLLLDNEGQINIMHIGGSHVQAGVWTEGLRNTLHTLLPDISVSRGLVFPYKAVGTTQPGDYNVEYGGSWTGCRNTERGKDCPLGLMGISASTTDSNAYLMITFRSNRNDVSKFRRLKIFFADGHQSYTMTFPNDAGSEVVMDSIPGQSTVLFSRPMDTIYLKLHKTDTAQRSFCCYGFRIESDKPGLYFDAIGNNGANLSSYLRCGLFQDQLRAISPDLIILSLGINDAYTRNFDAERYKTQYRALLATIHAAVPDCPVLFTTNNDSYYRRRYPNINGVVVQQAIFELGEEYHGGVWDLYTVMGGHKSINQWVSARLAQSDRIHFTRGGYHLIGSLLSEALVKAFMDYHSQHAPGG